MNSESYRTSLDNDAGLRGWIHRVVRFRPKRGAQKTRLPAARQMTKRFLVTIFNPHSRVSFGVGGPNPLFEKRIGNVDVSYGGQNAALSARIAAAAAALRHQSGRRLLESSVLGLSQGAVPKGP